MAPTSSNNFLSTPQPIVYLGGPIDGLDQTDISMVSIDLFIDEHTHLATYRPWLAFGNLGKKDVRGLAQINVTAMTNCALAIFDCRHAKTPAFGTCAEMAICEQAKVPYIVLVPKGAATISLRGYYPHAAIQSMDEFDFENIEPEGSAHFSALDFVNVIEWLCFAYIDALNSEHDDLDYNGHVVSQIPVGYPPIKMWLKSLIDLRKIFADRVALLRRANQ